MFELGVVYRDVNRSSLWLSVDRCALVSFADGVRVDRAPREKDAYEAVRTASVEWLCRRWGVDVEVIDAALAAFLAPSATGRNATRRHRGKRTEGERVTRGRTTTAADVEAWRDHRLHKVQHSR